MSVQRIVDNRALLLGLDDLYRDAMKAHERAELLGCAQETARVLSVGPANVPIEGYYAEDEKLIEYFRLMRAIQDVSRSRLDEVESLREFDRLRRLTESGLYGTPSQSNSILPTGMDALSEVLLPTFPNWTIENILRAAYDEAIESDDFSLVTLGALARDAVVLAALRETCVLYASAVGGGAFQEPEYVWTVDEVVQARAEKFVLTFNELFDDSLPLPRPENAAIFWTAYLSADVIGRCVRIGFDDSKSPIQHYHWAIKWDAKGEPLAIDFWDSRIWTTDEYRQKLQSRT